MITLYNRFPIPSEESVSYGFRLEGLNCFWLKSPKGPGPNWQTLGAQRGSHIVAPGTQIIFVHIYISI